MSGNRQIWGSQYTRNVDDILTTQQEISREISEKLRLQVTGADKQRLNRRQTVDPAAYQLYLQGRYQWNKRTLEGLQQSIDYFQQAIQKDPQYALAFAGQADAYALLADFNVLPAREVLPKVKSAAEKALSLDDTLAEAHTSLAWAEFHDLDWAGAEKEFKRAIELNASYPTAHSWYGELLMTQGHGDQALAEMTRAYELDALSPAFNLALGLSFLLHAPVCAGHRAVPEGAGDGRQFPAGARVPGAGVSAEAGICRKRLRNSRKRWRFPRATPTSWRRSGRPMPWRGRQARRAGFWTSSRSDRNRPTCSPCGLR